jgi:hypothetical protein
LIKRKMDFFFCKCILLSSRLIRTKQPDTSYFNYLILNKHFMKKNNISQVLAVILILISSAIYAQSNVAINSSAAVGNAAAILDLSTGNPGNQGFLAPTVALTNVTVYAPIASGTFAGSIGLIVYTKASPTGGFGPGFYYDNGTQWEFLENNGTVPSGSGTTNYLARWTPNGNTLGIGLLQDNGTDEGINSAPVAGTMLTLAGGANNGLNATSTYTAYAAATSYAVHGNDTLGADAYLGYNGDFNGTGLGITKAAGYFAGTAGNAPPFVSTVSGTNPNSAVIGVSENWDGGFFLTDYGGTAGVVAFNDSLPRSEASSDGDGVDGFTYQGYGEGVYGQNFYTTSTGVGVMGVGSRVSAVQFTPGTGVQGAGGQTGVAGYADSGLVKVAGKYPLSVAVSGGYFVNEEGSYSYVGATLTNATGTTETNYKVYGNGTASTVVNDVNDKRITLFCPEAPEVLFQDYGQGQLANGKIHIDLDPNYAKNVTVNEKHPLRVIITMNDACPNTVYVTNRTATGFDVIENNAGVSNASFTYEVVANRADEVNAKGHTISYADQRFPEGPGPMPVLNKAAKKRPASANHTQSNTQGQVK